MSSWAFYYSFLERKLGAGVRVHPEVCRDQCATRRGAIRNDFLKALLRSPMAMHFREWAACWRSFGCSLALRLQYFSSVGGHAAFP